MADTWTQDQIDDEMLRDDDQEDGPEPGEDCRSLVERAPYRVMLEGRQRRM